ncbi:hypothetical protein [Borrelia crocidurae]|nr:hypothetical protein [Borrelia crocidurae]
MNRYSWIYYLLIFVFCVLLYFKATLIKKIGGEEKHERKFRRINKTVEEGKLRMGGGCDRKFKERAEVEKIE